MSSGLSCVFTSWAHNSVARHHLRHRGEWRTDHSYRVTAPFMLQVTGIQTDYPLTHSFSLVFESGHLFSLNRRYLYRIWALERFGHAGGTALCTACVTMKRAGGLAGCQGAPRPSIMRVLRRGSCTSYCKLCLPTKSDFFKSTCNVWNDVCHKFRAVWEFLFWDLYTWFEGRMMFIVTSSGLSSWIHLSGDINAFKNV